MINVKLFEQTIVELEEHLAEKFTENCRLLNITYTVLENRDLQLLPILHEKTIALQLLNNYEKSADFINSIQKELNSHEAVCLLSNKKIGWQTGKYLDFQLVMSFKNNTIHDQSTVKLYTSRKKWPESEDITARIIKKLVNSALDTTYSIASWWDYLKKIKYRPFLSSTTPTLLIEFTNWEQLKKSQEEFKEIMTTGIIEHYKGRITKEDRKIIVTMVKDIYSEIKADSDEKDEEITQPEDLEVKVEEITTEQEVRAQPPEKAAKIEKPVFEPYKPNRNPLTFPGEGPVFQFSHAQKKLFPKTSPLQQNRHMSVNNATRSHSTTNRLESKYLQFIRPSPQKHSGRCALPPQLPNHLLLNKSTFEKNRAEVKATGTSAPKDEQRTIFEKTLQEFKKIDSATEVD